MTKVQFKTIDEYIASFPIDIQVILRQVNDTIRKSVPQATPKISYGIAAYKIGTKAIYFAAYKDYIGMYPMYGTEEIESQLLQYRAKNTKDTIHFLYKDPLPLDLISQIALIKLMPKEKPSMESQ